VAASASLSPVIGAGKSPGTGTIEHHSSGAKRLAGNAIRKFMPNGTVKFFNAAKGFGFITPDDGGKDIFVPTGTKSSADVLALKAGQRVAFETQPDTKGPKAVNLTLLPTAQPPKADKVQVPQLPKEQATARLTFYHDPGSEWSDKMLAEVRSAGDECAIIDYIATPPTRDELKRLSTLLKDGDQSLVRKYDALFQELRLDDRFLSENEFWDSVVEHPSLINGPLVASAAKARLCRAKGDVKSFLAGAPAGEVDAASKSKGLSARLLRLMAGETVPPAAPRVKIADEADVAPVKKAPAKTVTPLIVRPRTAPAPKTAPVKAAPVKTALVKTAKNIAAKPAPKPTKTVKPTKIKAVKKPAAAKGKR
jgi:arsenate reductase (glutaredoxin)